MQLFGSQIKDLDYQLRKGAYAVLFRDSSKRELGVIQSNGHYFLLGGGIEARESPEECLRRETLEEIGDAIQINRYIGEAQQYFLSRKRLPILSDGYFYTARLLQNVQRPIENNHFLKWVDARACKSLLFHEHQAWAVGQALQG
ncbi:NUDIX hydrolase [Sporolactobacillus shoreicorticis]|uniref:NUDIX hydrolase n=1 Tax=Sporolactobacillus shoreicorticis TaxID=1923877 RepID=UPI0025B78160